MRSLLSTIKYTFNNGKEFDLVEYFKEGGVNNKEDGEKLFKEAIHNLVNLPYDCKAKSWAKTVLGERFSLLNSKKLKEFWLENAINEVSDSRIVNFYQTEAEHITRITKKQRIDSQGTARETETHEDINVDIVDRNAADDTAVDGEEVDSNAASCAAVGREITDGDDLLNEVSFVSTSSGGDFVDYVDKENDQDFSYVMCFDEITPIKSLNNENVKVFKEDNCLETRLKLSGIKFEDLSDMNALPRTKLEEKEYGFIRRWGDAITDHDSDFFLSASCASEQYIINFLTTTYYNIINEQDYMKINPKKIKLEARENQEEDFKINCVVPLLNFLFNRLDRIYIKWDTPSNVYAHSKGFVIKQRPDATLIIKEDGVEIGCIEIKAYNADDYKVEMDRIRIGEITKKQLNRRISIAKNRKTLSTFGMMVYGAEVELFIHQFTSSNEYNFNLIKKLVLPTTYKTFANMRLSLEFLITFKNVMIDTLPTETDITSPYDLDLSMSMKPTATFITQDK